MLERLPILCQNAIVACFHNRDKLRKVMRQIISYTAFIRVFETYPWMTKNLAKAIAAFKNHTCIKLVPRTTEPDYVEFIHTGQGYARFTSYYD